MDIMEGFSAYHTLTMHKILTGDLSPGGIAIDPWYCRLSTTSFDADMGGLTIPAGASYVDYELGLWTTADKFLLTDNYPATTCVLTNDYDWEFVEAAEDWGTITSFCVLNIDTSVEYPRLGGSITTPVFVGTGMTVIFLKDAVSVTLNML